MDREKRDDIRRELITMAFIAGWLVIVLTGIWIAFAVGDRLLIMSKAEGMGWMMLPTIATCLAIIAGFGLMASALFTRYVPGGTQERQQLQFMELAKAFETMQAQVWKLEHEVRNRPEVER